MQRQQPDKQHKVIALTSTPAANYLGQGAPPGSAVRVEDTAMRSHKTGQHRHALNQAYHNICLQFCRGQINLTLVTQTYAVKLNDFCVTLEYDNSRQSFCLHNE
eukprot:scaffold57727_cov32-Prasinocladus_malaysianus.AAC.1